MDNDWAIIEVSKISEWVKDMTYTGKLVIEFNCHLGSVNDVKYIPTIRVEKPVTQQK